MRWFQPTSAGSIGLGLVLLMLSACGSLKSPVTASAPTLSERLAERSTHFAAGDGPSSDRGVAASTPEAIAFSEALGSGQLLRLTITTNGVDTALRAGPGWSYGELRSLASGEEVLATGSQTGEWVHVIYGDFEGWVASRRLSVITAESPEALVVADERPTTSVLYLVDGDSVGVNIRSEPHAQAELVSGAPVGSEVVGTGRTEGRWVEITFNGVTGWSSGRYLLKVGTVEG